jgi:hypothetical protein
MYQLSKKASEFGGVLHGDCPMGTDVEFPSILKAAEFVESMEWSEDAFMLLPVIDFDSPVVVTIPSHKVKDA